MTTFWRITQVEQEEGGFGFGGEQSCNVVTVSVNWQAIPDRGFFAILSEGRYLLRANFDRSNRPMARKTFCGPYGCVEPDAWVLPSPLKKELEQVNNLLDSLKGKSGGGNNSWLHMNMKMLEDRLVCHFDEFVKVDKSFYRGVDNNVTVIDVKSVTGLSYNDEVNESLEAATTPFHHTTTTAALTAGVIGGTSKVAKVKNESAQEYQEMEVDEIIQGAGENMTVKGGRNGKKEGVPWVYERYNFRSYPRLNKYK